jgi:hypothetical protein
MSTTPNIDEYSEYWSGANNDWLLMKVGFNHSYNRPDYTIIHSSSHNLVIIEDEQEYQAVVDKMLQHDAKVIDNFSELE